MNERVGQILGSKVGHVGEVESQRVSRARVHVQVSSSLKTGCWLTVSDGSRVWIDFKFEKLPDYYYICGCLDHNEGYCDKELELKYGCMEITKPCEENEHPDFADNWWYEDISTSQCPVSNYSKKL